MSYQKSFIPSESSREFVQVRKMWEHFLVGGKERLEELRPIVRDSWLRSQRRGIDPELKAAPMVLSQEQMQTLWGESVLREAAAPVLRFLCEALEGHCFLVMLADSCCRSLEVIGHPKALSRAEQINAVPGSQWLEDQVGTDALALSFLLDTPIQIHWSEHYCEIGHRWAGNSAPIHHPFSKEIMGTVNIYGYGEVAHPRALGLIADAATMIEQQLSKKELAQRLFLFERYNQYQSKFVHEALLCLDAKGTILLVSPGTRDLLRLPAEETLGRPLARLPGLHLPEPALAFNGSAQDVSLLTKVGSPLKATLVPVRKEHHLAGFIAILSAKSRSVGRAQADPAQWRALYTFANIVGESQNLRACVAQAQRMAEDNLPGLIAGESGVGKELFAHAIHNASARRQGPFVPLNCGGLNEELLSAELFGYVEGAFTGAVRGGRPGKLELAHGGTLFLDEVEEMSPKMQVHLLRVLEEGRVVRVGAGRPRPMDVRILASTNVDLEARVREGRFRPDLYYRLNVLALSLPPLRERSGDIPLLVTHLLSHHGSTKEVSAGALARLEAYGWPGNVRQLRNVLLQAADRAVGGIITEADLPSIVYPATGPFPHSKEESADGEATVLQKAEREAILRALRDCAGNISRAASRLGLHRVTLYRKMEKHGIKAERMWQ